MDVALEEFIKIVFLISPVTRRELIIQNHLSTNLTFFVSFWKGLQSDCRFCKKQCQQKMFLKIILPISGIWKAYFKRYNKCSHQSQLAVTWFQLWWWPVLTIPLQGNVCTGPSIANRKVLLGYLIRDGIQVKDFIQLFLFKDSLKLD